jgi:peptidoglycan LD-endopeptidase CwlK
MRPLADRFLAKLMEARIPVMIVTTSRTPAEQTAAVARGVSWTLKSKHLTGDAIDVAPYESYQIGSGPDKIAWDAKHKEWETIGAIGESVGLVWGGRWKQRDLGHFELPASALEKKAP